MRRYSLTLTQTAGPPQIPKIYALTSLRFFAALFVVLYHVSPSFFPSLWDSTFPGSLVQLGFVPVSFFFLLSGYILGVVYLGQDRALNLGVFYKARFVRIYPVFLLTLALDAPNLFYTDWTLYGFKSAVAMTGVRFFANAAMLQAWILRMRGIDNPNWSLSVEAFFYLVFPLLGFAIWKLRGRWLWIVAGIVYLSGQILVLLVAPRVDANMGKFFPILHLSTFALGILFARWERLNRQRDRHAAKSGYFSPNLVLVAIALVSSAVVVWSFRILNASLYDGLLAPIFICLIWAFSQPNWRVAQYISHPWLVALGESSLGLYLFHIPVFHLFERMGWQQNAWFFPAYLAIAISLSLLSFHYFEFPMREWLLARWMVIPVRPPREIVSSNQTSSSFHDASS